MDEGGCEYERLVLPNQSLLSFLQLFRILQVQGTGDNEKCRDSFLIPTPFRMKDLLTTGSSVPEKNDLGSQKETLEPSQIDHA